MKIFEPACVGDVRHRGPDPGGFRSEPAAAARLQQHRDCAECGQINRRAQANSGDRGRSHRMRRTLLAILFFVALIAIWAGLVRAGFWSPVLLPSPANVGEYLVAATRDGTLLTATDRKSTRL